MWKTVAILGGIAVLSATFILWCACKVGSDDDDFWGISDAYMEDVYNEKYRGKK